MHKSEYFGIKPIEGDTWLYLQNIDFLSLKLELKIEINISLPQLVRCVFFAEQYNGNFGAPSIIAIEKTSCLLSHQCLSQLTNTGAFIPASRSH